METKIINKPEIEGDLYFDGLLRFECNCEITGSLQAVAVSAACSLVVHKSYTVHKNDEVGGFQKVGGSQEVGGKITCKEYINLSFHPIDLKKIDTKRIRFCTSYCAERRFWAAQFSEIKELSDFILDDDNCFASIIRKGKEHKKEIFSLNYMPAVLQAIKIHFVD